MINKPVKKIILLVNLGSPDKCAVDSIKYFLQEFLSDKRVVGLPRLLWYPILYGVILPFRSKKLLHKYQQIWLDNDKSPLHHYTSLQSIQLNDLLKQQADNYKVFNCYSYGENNINNVLSIIHLQNKDGYELSVIPLYPQYSSSTTASVFDAIGKFYQHQYYVPQMKFITSFATNQSYIDLLATKIKEHWAKFGKADKLVVSFHSIPQKLVDNGDLYQQECQQTFELLRNNLGLTKDKAVICYQSKFGKAKWIEPSTESMIKKLAKQNCHTLDVICPGFVSDCLETLEEVQVEYAELFISSGGKQLNYIQCFNDDVRFVKVLQELI